MACVVRARTPQEVRDEQSKVAMAEEVGKMLSKGAWDPQPVPRTVAMQQSPKATLTDTMMLCGIKHAERDRQTGGPSCPCRHDDALEPNASAGAVFVPDAVLPPNAVAEGM